MDRSNEWDTFGPDNWIYVMRLKWDRSTLGYKNIIDKEERKYLVKFCKDYYVL